jgi:putative N6-adenine-specific DNA methylase
LEQLAAGELSALGIPARREEGGAAFEGPIDVIARANLWLRTASRVIVRVASFRAQAFYELERRARAVAWERYIAPGAPVRLRVTSRKSRLYHTGAIDQRLTEAIAHRLGHASVVDRAAADEDTEALDSDAQLFVVRVLHDNFTISVDSSGALLHQRGYRKAVAKAPMRETLAAAILIATGWTGDTPLLDPMCGSGTIPIEGALLARRMAPGIGRSFAFERWPESAAARCTDIRLEAKSVMLPRAPSIIRGSDRDAGAIAAARANAERAGVLDDIDFVVQPVSRMVCRDGQPALIATNPPYGVRVGEVEGLRDLYARFGQVLRASCRGSRVAMLSANARLDGQLRLPLKELLRSRNGGIPVKVLSAQISG